MKGDSPISSLLTNLAASLVRLRAPLEEQVEYLSQFGGGQLIDELALDFEGYFKPLEPRLAVSQDWAETLELLRTVDSELDSDELDWRIDALRNPEWSEIRQISSMAEQSLLEHFDYERQRWNTSGLEGL